MRNALGDIRAEADNAMLSRAFLETADYRTLVETSDRTVIVGRRGTGKSALALQLRRFLDRDSDTVVISIIPEEHQTIGLRPHANAFGTQFSTVRAGARIAWRYALVMETALALSPTYSFRERPAYARLAPHVDRWRSPAPTSFTGTAPCSSNTPKARLRPRSSLVTCRIPFTSKKPKKRSERRLNALRRPSHFL